MKFKETQLVKCWQLENLEEPWDDWWKGQMPHRQFGFSCSELTAPSSKAGPFREFFWEFWKL